MLTADHRAVQKLFKAFDKRDRGDEASGVEIVETACVELKVHAIIEEEIFYPAVRSKLGDEGESLLLEAAVEHEVAELLIDRLGELEPGEPEYAATFAVLAEYVQQHIKDEEKQLFPRVRKLNELDLEELGAEMQARKDELLSEIEMDVALPGDEETHDGEETLARTPADSGEAFAKRFLPER